MTKWRQAAVQRDLHGPMGHPAEAEDAACGSNARGPELAYLISQITAAGFQLRRVGPILRRQTLDRIGQSNVDQPRRERIRVGRQAGSRERGKQKRTAGISRKRSAGAVGAVQTGREPNQQQLRAYGSRGANGQAAVVGVGFPDPIEMRGQTGAHPTSCEAFIPHGPCRSAEVSPCRGARP